MLKTSTKAPNLILNSTTDKLYSLKDSLGKYVVLYFHHKDDTPRFPIEINDFNKLLNKFKILIVKFLVYQNDDLKKVIISLKKNIRLNLAFYLIIIFKLLKVMKFGFRKNLWVENSWVL